MKFFSKATSWIILISSILICALSVSVIIKPQSPYAQVVDNWVKPVSDIAVYGAMLFAALALLVAAMAYRQSVASPKLTLLLNGRDVRYQEITCYLHSRTSSIVRVEPDWDLWMVNSGSVSAKYAVIEINFGVLRPTVSGWKSYQYDHLGPNRFRWASGTDEVIHPNFPVKVGGVGWLHRKVDIQKDTRPNRDSIEITIAADGFFRPPFSKQLHIKYVENEAMEEWLKRTFPIKGENVVVERPDGAKTLPITTWLSCQLGSRVPPTYNDIQRQPIYQEPGWKSIIDHWHETGIV